MESEKSNANPAMRSEMLRWRGHSYAPYGPKAHAHTHTHAHTLSGVAVVVSKYCGCGCDRC